MASGIGDGDGAVVMEEEDTDTAESSGDAIFMKYPWEDSALCSDMGEVGEPTLQTEIEDLREARLDGGIRNWVGPGGEANTQKPDNILSTTSLFTSRLLLQCGVWHTYL